MFHVVIPARFASTRLPGKPLIVLGEKPMIEHVWERAREAAPSEVWIATDDARIQRAVAAFGGRALMTSPSHSSGTERLAEVAHARGWPDEAIVVNLQGDEPFMPASLVQAVARELEAAPEAGIATIAVPIRSSQDLFNPNVVKVVRDAREMALYFSRAPIPWIRGLFENGPPPALPPEFPFLRHLGLYAYRVGTLKLLVAAPPGSHERAESLEQLRALALGVRIKVVLSSEDVGPGVDTPDDVISANARLGRTPAT